MLDITDFNNLKFREEDFKDTPRVDIDGVPILETLPERWKNLMRSNAKARETWESTSYPSLSEQAYALMGLCGLFGLDRTEAVAVHVVHYARHDRKEDGVRKASYALKAWREGRKRAEVRDGGLGGGQSVEREPDERQPWKEGDWSGKETIFEGATTGTAPGPDEKQEQEREGSPRPPLVIPAPEFLGRPRPEQVKLIPGLGGRRGGKLGLYGPGGSGKSYTFLNIAVAAAEGKPLLKYPEWSPTSSLRVAFLSLEDPAAEQLDRLSRLLGYYELPEAPQQLFIFDRDLEEEGFVLAGIHGRINERAFQRLDSCLGDLKIDLLLVEPKRYLVEVDENSSTENMPWQRRFQDVLIRHGTLAFIGHHAGWEKEGKIHARGTTAFRDWVDGMIQQKEDRIQGKPGFQFTCDKSNFAPRWEPLSILFYPETGGMEAVDETTGKLPPARLRACFTEHGGQIKGPVENVRKVVAQYADCSPMTARRAIEAAIKEGWLRKLGHGKGVELSPHEGSQR